jgi:hypothetical protein
MGYEKADYETEGYTQYVAYGMRYDGFGYDMEGHAVMGQG